MKELRWSVLFLAAGLGFTPRPCAAADVSLAERLFQEGKAGMEANDWPRACPKLAESFAQDPATGTLLALALCQEKWGKLASAWQSYTTAAARAAEEGNADRQKAATARARALEARRSTLTVEVPPAVAAIVGLTVRCNQVPLDPSAWGKPIPLDGGEFTVEVSAPGKKAAKLSGGLAAQSEAKSVTLPPLEDAAVQASPSVSSVAPVAPRPPVSLLAPSLRWRVERSQGGSLRLGGMIGIGVGLAGAGVGTYFGLRAKSLKAESNADGHCDALGCDDLGSERRWAALDAAQASTIAFVAGGALAAGGVVLYLVGKNQEQPARISAVPTRHGLGLVLSGEL